ncbi:MAG TPA: GH92 family glycosyl hydrolase [Pyrinomonadaceae bacterium]|jgi:predicted alpha-1,2-mannosidase|nr:GH92 family glycosyl hydrolase [Pyrinomonadaceae bacterium]
MNLHLRIFTLLLLLTVSISAQTKDFTHYVDPFIGTGGHGHTFPGATLPFGMVQLSPDTRIDNWDGSSGYHYSDDIIYGFSHTHLSGTGIPDYCDILLMPVSGSLQFNAKAGDKTVNGYASKFSHANEKAEPGYYSVKLEDDNILAEMTATTRVGLHRYTFTGGGRVNIMLDLKWRDQVLDSDLNIVGNRIEGFRRSSSWAKDQLIYFVIEFSKPPEYKVATTSDDGGKAAARPDGSPVRKGMKAAIQFDVKPGEQIMAKVALSPVSIEGARKNLAAELPGWDFEKVRAAAKAAWNKQLSKIEVSGGTKEQTVNFYTALYHTAIQPNIFQDVDGQYRGLDKKIHTASKDTNYTVFSLWDTFRAAHPLYTIIDQKRTADFINTFIRQYEQGGRLPVWELAGNETECMIGYHAVSVIADAMEKSIKGFDYEKAYEAAKHSAELDHFGLAAYKKRGYISMEDEQESVSKTLEYAYDDYCISQMASVLYTRRATQKNYTAEQANADPVLQRYASEGDHYSIRAGYYENLFDSQTGFMRPKQNGGFVKPFAPNEVTFHFTEGNSWVYSFFVPHDLDRLIELHGGRDKFAAKLDALFTTTEKLAGREQPDITGLIGQYAHGNEPSHHIAYLYDYAGQPWKTQKYVRHILDEFYKPAPDGLIGNEDCGQMSAWYVLSASGFYAVTPGQEGVYVLGTPLFPEVKYHLENGKTFTIRARNVSSANKYISSAKINGVRTDAPILTHKDLMSGAMLELEMTDKPSMAAFTGFPGSALPGDSVAVPLIDGGGRLFNRQTSVTLSATEPAAKIHFTIDGSTPTVRSPVYTAPISIDSTTTVKAITQDPVERTSLIAEATFHKKPHDWTVKIANKYNRQYTGGGDEGLIDGIRGTLNFASGEWQGYQPYDLDAVIDLQRETEIRRVGGGFLQDAGPWIWMPTHIEFEVSQDNITWTKVADIKTDVDPRDMKATMRDYKQAITPIKARYVRVHAYNLGKIPAWHPGAGDDAFIFVDEIFIE